MNVPKKQKQYYSGKKKKHTIKTLVFVNKKTHEIIAISQDKGKNHDFKMYKDTVGSAVSGNVKIQVNSGFQGIGSLHKNRETPKKKSKKHPLTRADKDNNRRISKGKILIENVNAKLKVFEISSNKYRNRRKRHALRMSLICGIYNFELKL